MDRGCLSCSVVKSSIQKTIRGQDNQMLWSNLISNKANIFYFKISYSFTFSIGSEPDKGKDSVITLSFGTLTLTQMLCSHGGELLKISLQERT